MTVGQKIKRKIRTGDSIFLRKTVQKGKSYQVHINSPNTIIYAAAKSKCTVPNAQCRERTGNYHHPFVFEAKQDDELLINVEGLENSEF